MTKHKDDLTDLIGFLAVIVIFGCLAAVISGCSPDVPIACCPACECGPGCSCEKCECDR